MLLRFLAPIVLSTSLILTAQTSTTPQRADVRSAADDEVAIRQHRMGRLVIHTAPGAEVKVEQLRHEFWFGATLPNSMFDGTMRPDDRARYEKVFLENFNAAVTEVALKWHDMEEERGKVDYRLPDAMLAWSDQHGIPLRGHNIYWGIDQFVQPWLKQLDNDTLRQVLKERAFDVGRRYRGRFAEYDLNNEMIHGNLYAERLGPTITRDMVNWVREADPSAILYLNDYDILTGKKLDAYVAHIRELRQMGVRFDGIGVQGHLHGDSFDPAALRHALDTLAQFGLPVRVTEFNFPGQRSKFYEKLDLPITAAEEEAKARAIAEYYRICFAHPVVTGILMWGFWEGANWIPQSSLYKRDWTPTPAAHAYRKLVFGDWWTKWSGKADANGRCEIPAFYGTFRVTAEGQTTEVTLTKADGSADVRLR